MASSFTLIALFSLALFADIIEARKDPGVYWQDTAKREALVEATESLVHLDSNLNNGRKITNADCHTSLKKESFVKDFEPRPNVSAYGKDGKLEQTKSFIKDFEPRPNVSAYGDDGKLEENKSFIKDFEPTPSATAYGNDAKLKKHQSFMKDFEPRPSATAYGDDAKLKQDKSFMKDFEPRPSATAYQE